jgi:hypothetical protein
MEDIEKRRLRARRWAAKNQKRVAVVTKAWQAKHREKCVQYQKDWKLKNPEKYKAIRQKQRSKRAAWQGLRRARKLHATPKWLTKEHVDEMKRIYMNCPDGYHVDHIIPLQGKNVCGLHVPWNLQYLPALENMSKGNRLIEVQNRS